MNASQLSSEEITRRLIPMIKNLINRVSDLDDLTDSGTVHMMHQVGQLLTHFRDYNPKHFGHDLPPGVEIPDCVIRIGIISPSDGFVAPTVEISIQKDPFGPEQIKFVYPEFEDYYMRKHKLIGDDELFIGAMKRCLGNWMFRLEEHLYLCRESEVEQAIGSLDVKGKDGYILRRLLELGAFGSIASKAERKKILQGRDSNGYKNAFIKLSDEGLITTGNGSCLTDLGLLVAREIEAVTQARIASGHWSAKEVHSAA